MLRIAAILGGLVISAFPLLAWVATVVLLGIIVCFDLVVIGRRSGPVTLADSSRWVVFYVALAVTFGGVLFVSGPPGAGAEFFAGYLTEYSLSVDNLFVFLIIMSRFAVPAGAQDKVLYIGIVLSMLLRTVLIILGAAAISAATWTFVLFGAFLVYTAVRLIVSNGDDGGVEEGIAVRAMRRVLPVTPEYEGRRFVVRRGERRFVTPLLLAVSAIGIANVIFALDSIPAIFGLTNDAFVVLTANAFALMGLRQLYFMIGGLVENIAYLNYGLAAILGFIGIKLVIEGVEPHVDHLGPLRLPQIDTATSLLVILGLLLVVAAANAVRAIVVPRRSDSA